MSTHRPRRIGRGAAEQLLRGGPVNAGVGTDPLADLLAAVAAPAHDGELDGEEAAVAAFREARLAHVTQPRRESMSKLLLAKLLTVKAAAMAIGVTAIGGAAAAASTGVLPVVGGGGSAVVSPTATPSAEVSVPSINVPSADASVSASLLALCHTYAAAAAADASTALDSPNMSALVTAAGGRDQVGTFCGKALQAEVGATLPGAAAGASAGPGGASLGVDAGPSVGASAGPDGTGLGVDAGPSAGASAGPDGTGVGAQLPSAGTGASAGPNGAGLDANAGPGAGTGANAGQGGAGLGASAAPSIPR